MPTALCSVERKTGFSCGPSSFTARTENRPQPSTTKGGSLPRQSTKGKPITLPKAEPAAKPIDLGSLIEEARELRGAVQGMFARSKNLIAALQRQHRKARIVDSTLASLKKLQGKVQQ